MATGIEIAQRAKEQLVELTKLPVDTVSGLTKQEDGWHVTVELIELKRIPESTDMLATYDALLDEQGHLLHYQRTRRYLRDQIMEPEA
ncbi:MAG: gas vesicle protein [Chloroflexi bacterium]|nr:gas vesicle protein [Chloroflexota bacterium]MBU1746919.1 gas vesicle protein [Chloroflexota bacterium]MBU1878225.1 gas vesicle protein [Chloroflexota bacterium]